MPYVGTSPANVTDSASINATGTVTAGDLEVDSGTLSIDASNNRVGIGTTSPANVLDVTGDARITTDLTVGDDVSLLSDAAVLNFGANSEIKLTHVHDTGLLLTDSGGTPTLQIHDSAESISSDGSKLILTSNSVAFSLPTADGSSGQFLKTDGSGTLSFATVSTTTNLDDIATGDAATTLATSAGNITIDAQGSDTDIIFKGTDGSTDTTFLTLDGSDAGTATFNHDVKLGDDGELVFGDGGDLTIRHDSSNNVSFIEETGSSNFHIRGNQIVLKSQTDNDDFAKFIENGAVELYHSNAKKFETTSSGISVTGAIEASGSSTITNSDNTDTLTLKCTDADANAGPVLNLLRAGSSPADADQIGRIDFSAESDLGSETNYAVIKVFSGDVSHGVEDGQFSLFTRVNGSEVERMTVGSATTIFNDGGANLDFRVEGDTVTSLLHIDAGNDAVMMGANAPSGDELLLAHSPDNRTITVLNAASESYSQDVIDINCHRSQTSSFNFVRMMSDANSGQDSEFIFAGNGSAFADGTYNNNGADYAEYFETNDGNGINVGKTVVLDGNKVRASTSSDDTSTVIGVVRPKDDGINSMIIGNTAWNRWTNKYLHDDYGSFIMEDYTVTEWTEIDSDGDQKIHSYKTEEIPSDVTVPSDAEVKTFQRPKLNPDFDESMEYKPRSERDEWVIIGMLGQIQVEKGQKTGTNWIKMRDISETVEEWLVR